MTKRRNGEKRVTSRRQFLKATGAGALGLGIGSAMIGHNSLARADGNSGPPFAASGGEPGGPYNVLFILTDQERYLPELLGKGVWPGRDRLANMGVTFTNHQVCSMVCTPSRSTIFTGRHIQHTGMFDNTNFPWVDNMSFDIPTIGHMMREAGYYTAYEGKWHLHEQIHEHFPEGEPLQLVGHDLMERYGFSDFTGIGDIVGSTLGGYFTDEFVASTAQTWLRRKGKPLNQEGRPWFLTLSLVNPHDVMFYNTDAPDQNVQGKYKTMFPIAREPDNKIYERHWDLPLSPSRKQPWNEPGRPNAHREYQKCRNFLVGGFPNEDSRWTRLQNYYLNCITDCDRSVERIMNELENLGLLDNTIVIFTSDHGELCGAHGMHGKGATAYREQNNVSFIIYHPEYQGGKKCEALTSHVDIVPTILAMTGADKKQKPGVMDKLHGHDMSHVLEKTEKASQDAVRASALYCYSMWCTMDADWLGKVMKASAGGEKLTFETAPKPDPRKRSAIRTVFDGRYKFSRYFSMKQHNRPTTMEQIFKYNDVELYDLENDPSEINNLAVDRKKNGDLLMAMNEKLNAVINTEVGEDKGQMLPDIKGVNWAIERFDI